VLHGYMLNGYMVAYKPDKVYVGYKEWWDHRSTCLNKVHRSQVNLWMEFDSCNVTSYKPPFNILDQIWLYLLMKDSTYS